MLLLGAGCGGAGNPQNGNVVWLPKNDPAVAAAAAKAQRLWPQFARSFATSKPGAVYSVKHAFPTADGSREHMWVAVKRIDGKKIVGTLANKPIGKVGLAYGDQVTLTRQEIEDWFIESPDGSELGGFSEEPAGGR